MQDTFNLEELKKQIKEGKYKEEDSVFCRELPDYIFIYTNHEFVAYNKNGHDLDEEGPLYELKDIENYTFSRNPYIFAFDKNYKNLEEVDEDYVKLINRYRNKEISEKEYEDSLSKMVIEFPSPLRELYILNSYFYKSYYCVPKKHEFFLKYASRMLFSTNQIAKEDKDRVKCALLNSYFSNCNYEEAEQYASELLNNLGSDPRVFRELANYYTKTRRYDLAEKLYKRIIDLGEKDLITNDYEIFNKVVRNEQKPYLPLNHDKQRKYLDFMSSLNIQVN